MTAPDDRVRAVDTKALREMLSKATPGPWATDYDHDHGDEMFQEGHQYEANAFVMSGNFDPDCAALIVAAVNSLPALLDAYEERQRGCGPGIGLLNSLRAQLAAEREKAAAAERELAAERERAAKEERERKAEEERRAAAPDREKLVAFAAELRTMALPVMTTARGQEITAKIAERLRAIAKQIDDAAAGMGGAGEERAA